MQENKEDNSGIYITPDLPIIKGNSLKPGDIFVGITSPLNSLISGQFTLKKHNHFKLYVSKKVSKTSISFKLGYCENLLFENKPENFLFKFRVHDNYLQI